MTWTWNTWWNTDSIWYVGCALSWNSLSWSGIVRLAGFTWSNIVGNRTLGSKNYYFSFPSISRLTYHLKAWESFVVSHTCGTGGIVIRSQYYGKEMNSIVWWMDIWLETDYNPNDQNQN
jgi:hypothetical protein